MTGPDAEKRLQALITGASSGLGEAVARTFARNGIEVLLVARRITKLRKVHSAISRQGGIVHFLKVDLRSTRSIGNLIEYLNDNGGVDILINNAGVYYGGTDLDATSVDVWDEMLAVNLRAPYLLAKACLPSMRAGTYGRVVNVISATRELCGVGAFRVSKIGLEVVSSVLAKEQRGSGVSISAFNPGWMKTETSSSGRSPRTVARILCKLILRKSAHLNDQTFDVVGNGHRAYARRRRKSIGRFG